jgi:hypothetical protein
MKNYISESIVTKIYERDIQRIKKVYGKETK